MEIESERVVSVLLADGKWYPVAIKTFEINEFRFEKGGKRVHDADQGSEYIAGFSFETYILAKDVVEEHEFDNAHTIWIHAPLSELKAVKEKIL